MTQTIHNILGETVNYTYDYLHRLIGATATNNAWGEAYSYDGFGNLTAKTPTVGSAPSFSAVRARTPITVPCRGNGTWRTAHDARRELLCI